MQRIKTASGSSFGARVVPKSNNFGGAVRAAGIWGATARGPISVEDPEQFTALVSSHGLRVPEYCGEGLIHYGEWESIRDAVFGRAGNMVRELERLVHGGSTLWRDDWHNLVVNDGLNDILTQYFKGSSYTAAHYIGLTDGTPTPAAGDTMSSHSGWTEVTDYGGSTRPTFTAGTVSSQSVDNSGSVASFSINSDSTTVGGAFCSTDDTKGGTAGVLYSVGAFSGGDKSLDNGDTLEVTATFTQADDGA